MNMKTNLDKHFKADPRLEKDGVEFTISDTTGFTVRRFSASNPQVKAAFAAHYKPYTRQIQMGTLDPEKERDISIKVFVNACLVNWRGVVNEETQQEIPFSKENAINLFKALPDLFESLMEYSQNLDNYKEDLGNSSSNT